MSVGLLSPQQGWQGILVLHSTSKQAHTLWHLLHEYTCSWCCLLHYITFWVPNPSLTHVRGGTFCTNTPVLGATFHANMHVVGATFCISAHVLGSSLLPSAPTHMLWVLTSALVNTHVLVLYSALTHMFCVLATFCTS